MMLSDLAVTCIISGILTAIAGALCDLLLKSQKKHRQPNTPTDTSAPE